MFMFLSAPRARVRHGGGDRVHRQDARGHVHDLLARHQRNHRGCLRLRAIYGFMESHYPKM